MNSILIAFITGLTTGGLSCLAVQGGLLASSLAAQVEQDLLDTSARKDRSGKRSLASRVHLALPILLFLLAKLVVYTLLGALLGAAGSLFQLTPITRGILQAAIGVFMIGSALRIFNVHPIYRYISFEPPAFLRRYIRRVSRRSEGTITPLFLGALTVFIPCGITQAMMALAIGTGSPLTGAAILFAFTLGTSPLFFAAAYFTSRFGTLLEKHFMRFVAIVLLVLGFLSLDAGLTLAGSPYSPSNLMIRLHQPWQPTGVQQAVQTPLEQLPQGTVELVVQATNQGYSPEFLQAPAGQPVILSLQTQDTFSCSRAFTIPELGVEAILPATGKVRFDLPAQKPGKLLYFTCSMGMYGGAIQFN
jgi:sulfite exporter TauE/SafE